MIEHNPLNYSRVLTLRSEVIWWGLDLQQSKTMNQWTSQHMDPRGNFFPVRTAVKRWHNVHSLVEWMHSKSGLQLMKDLNHHMWFWWMCGTLSILLGLDSKKRDRRGVNLQSHIHPNQCTIRHHENETLYANVYMTCWAVTMGSMENVSVNSWVIAWQKWIWLHVLLTMPGWLKFYWNSTDGVRRKPNRSPTYESATCIWCRAKWD